MYRRRKKISLFVVLTMLFSYILPVYAANDWQQQVLADYLKVGYTDVYIDNKPSVPNSILNIQFSGDNIIGKEYETVLLDVNDNEIDSARKSGIIDSNPITIDLEIPGTLQAGKYTVKTTIDNISNESEIVLLNNINLDSRISTNVTNYSGNLWDLTDGIQWAMYTPIANKPTHENPAIFTFDYENNLYDIYSLDLFSTYGNNQGTKTAEILYWDIKTQEWKNILNNGNKEFEFKWEKNIECEPIRINFDQVYTTNKIMLKTIDSYTSWENTNDIVEVQVWGNKSKALPSVEMDSFQGVFGVENIVLLTIKNNDVTSDMKLELVDYTSRESLDEPIVYDTKIENGELKYNFVIPNSVAIGSYSIHVICDGLDIYTEEYRIQLNQDINMQNCSKYFKVSSLDNEKEIGVLTDGDLTSTWKSNDDASLLFEVKPENNKFANIVLKKLKVYGQKDSIENITLKSVAGTNYYRNINVDENGMVNNLVEKVTPEWKNDENGDYFEIDPNFLSLGNIFVLELSGSKQMIIDEINIDGLYLKDNILSEAKIYHNNELIDSHDMTDNNVASYYKTVNSEAEEYIIDFSPRTITTNELIYTAHFPNSQGVKDLSLEIFENNEWKSVEQFAFNHKTDNQIRESQQLIFEQFTTSKIKLIVNQANTVWDNSYLFTDLNAIGKINENAQYIADNLDTNIVINQGMTKFPLPLLDGKYVESYSVSINSSSREDIIDLTGNINADKRDVNVEISLKVSDRSGQDIGITNLFEVTVPHQIKSGDMLISTTIDHETIYNNPSMGWVQYYEFQNTNVDEYWQKMDELYAQGLKTNILYIRNPWSWYEPSEGNYAWLDENSDLSKLVRGARERGIQLAFRVMVDSTDVFQQATPEYVFDAGATYYKTDRTDSTAPDINAKDPYINDPIFLEKLDKFIAAFAKEFNDDLDIAYIDGMGFGNWGEVHHVKYNTRWDSNISDAIEKVVKIYNKHFPDVLLGAQEGQPENYGTQESDELINNNTPYTGAFEKEYDFVVRRDTFGWMTDAIRNQILEWFNKGIPVFAENCYHSFKLREYWYNNAGYPTLDGILRQVVDDALTCRANTLDARVVMDCQSWLENDQKNGSGLLNKFAINGGYRLAPTTFEVPEVFETGKDINISHAWQNYGLGILPNKNKHWDNKYHVAFALLDCETNEVVFQYNETTDKVNPGDWLKENGSNRYDTTIKLPDTIKSGEYKLATAIVNDKNNNLPEINLALKDNEKTDSGWYVLDNIMVENENIDEKVYKIIIDDTENGTIQADKLNVKEGEDIILTFKPDEGYCLSSVVINNQLVKITNNQYVIKNISSDQHIQASFKLKETELSNKNDSSDHESKKISPKTGDILDIVQYIYVTLIAFVILLLIKRKKVV